MLSGKALIIATKPYAKEFKAKSWIYMLSTLFLLFCSLMMVLFISYFSIRILASVFSGLFIVRMFVIYHDHQHHAILNRSRLAHFIMTAFGIYVLAPSSIWKRSHDYHHKHNSKLFSASIGSFPIATKKKYLSMSAAERRYYLFIRHPLTILFGYFTMFILGMCVSSFISNPRKHLDSLVALLLHVIFSVWVFCYFGWLGWLLAIVLPFFIACGIGSYLFYAQHNFPGVFFNNNEDWAYDTAALESSSYMMMNPFMEWVTANIGYHHVHHLNSRIPFYRLPEVMADFPELQKVKTTSLSLKEIFACLRLKIWDQDNKTMIGLNEL